MTEGRKTAKHRCQICGRPGDKAELVVADLVRPVVVNLIKKSFGRSKYNIPEFY